jgi:hypothetical protein
VRRYFLTSIFLSAFMGWLKFCRPVFHSTDCFDQLSSAAKRKAVRCLQTAHIVYKIISSRCGATHTQFPSFRGASALIRASMWMREFGSYS